tara:strand:- start:207 stop:674 length:468 start_codon:yes stop_codon:yes gene_type:complete
MSAYIVSKKHIDTLLTVAYGDNLITKDLTATGEILRLANLESIHAKYQDTRGHDSDSDRLPGYVWDCVPYQYEIAPLLFIYSEAYPPRREIQIIAALRLLDCYEYQTSEFSGWVDSQAFKECHHIRATLTGELISGPIKEVSPADHDLISEIWSI